MIDIIQILLERLLVIAAIVVSFTYVAGQMRGVGVVFARFLEVPINTGVFIGMAYVFIYAVLGGMKGITYTQVAQYCILIFAYMVPAIFISLNNDRKCNSPSRIFKHRKWFGCISIGKIRYAAS